MTNAPVLEPPDPSSSLPSHHSEWRSWVREPRILDCAARDLRQDEHLVLVLRLLVARCARPAVGDKEDVVLEPFDRPHLPLASLGREVLRHRERSLLLTLRRVLEDGSTASSHCNLLALDAPTSGGRSERRRESGVNGTGLDVEDSQGSGRRDNREERGVGSGIGADVE